MKNLLRGIVACAVVLGVLSVQLMAATPQDQRTDKAWISSSLQGSSATASSFNNTNGISIVLASAGTNNQNCLTFLKFDLGLDATGYLLDGGTTIFYQPGYDVTIASAIAISGYSQRLWNKGEPLCGSFATSMTMSIPAGINNTRGAVINYEGYVPARN